MRRYFDLNRPIIMQKTVRLRPFNRRFFAIISAMSITWRGPTPVRSESLLFIAPIALSFEFLIYEISSALTVRYVPPPARLQ